MAANGLEWKTLKEGDGKNVPKKGSQVTVHYTGRFPNGGKEFDSSVRKNRPFVFTLGVGDVIQGWDIVVAQLSVGQKVLASIPAAMAYGATGAGGVIPPNANLEFEIELLSFE